MYEADMAFDATRYLARVTAQTLVLHRKEDQLVPISAGMEVAAAIPGARLVALDGSTTFVALGDTSRAVEAIDAFLPKTTQSQSGSQTENDQRGSFRMVLFTDLVGHTEMMSRLGDARGREVLREHEHITREVLKTHGGLR
ncbi:MAG TPA: hypothetical protein VGR43_05945 [Dehalococcoidia bacterium]|jgi:class 3 adenylate cyclase|nr:hypothetical protein [Dehalococcoidia bacterium]